MYKLILAVVFTVSTTVYAQNNYVSTISNTVSNSQDFDNLYTSVQSDAGKNSTQPDLSDFRNKVQRGLDFMRPGSSIVNLRCEKIKVWSESFSEAFHSYLAEKYKADTDLKPGWLESIISDFRNKHSQFGIMHWEIVNSAISKSVKSIAIFDESWNVLFDTELVNYIVYSESDELMQGDNSSTSELSAIKNQDSQTKSRLLTLQNGILGSVQLYYEARVTAIVSPYIEASTINAEYNYYTNHIICERKNIIGIPPEAEPFLYFGTGGAYAIQYQNATPSESPITITGGTGDRFRGEIYSLSGSNGLNWSFDFDFSVDFPGGSIGITPVSSISALSLGANNNSSINLLNYVYNHNVLIGDVRAVFFDGGSLNADNFYILTDSGAGEIGKINVTSKLRAGYISGTFAAQFFPETSSAFNFPVQYLRGDHLLKPDYQLTSTRYNIPIGQIDTLKAKIINNSHAVNLDGGSISIDVSSLNDRLTLLSPATISIGSIDTSASKEFKFIVRGNSNGIVTPQANISSMGWGFPVPPDVTEDNIVSINSNIEVAPVIKTLTLTMSIQGFYDSDENSMIRDTAGVYLRNNSSPYNILDSAKTKLNTSGEGVFLFSNVSNYTQYYIQTAHRNSIETWSKTAQTFINSGLNYNFSTSNTQAFGDNMINVDASPLKYALYSGDVNQDGAIDLNDVLQIYNAANIFITGYVVTDLTGENTTDLSDMLIAYNNSTAFIDVVKP